MHSPVFLRCASHRVSLEKFEQNIYEWSQLLPSSTEFLFMAIECSGSTKLTDSTQDSSEQEKIISMYKYQYCRVFFTMGYYDIKIEEV